MAKIDQQGLMLGLSGFGIIAAVLYLLPMKFLRSVSMLLFVFIGLELILVFSSLSVFELVWRLLHMPSTIVLGADEILERHGIFLSSLMHVADLLLWSVLLSLPFIFSKELRTQKQNV